MENWFLVRLCMVLAVILASALLIMLYKMVRAAADKFKAKVKESVQ